MTVKKKKRQILSLTILLLAFCVGHQAFAQKKNVLRIRFQTAIISPSTIDTTLNVYYTLEVAKPPVNFTAFDCRYAFENTKIQPINMDEQGGFFVGTACANADFAHGTFVPPGEYRVQVDGSTMLDTSNPILFQVRYSVKPGTTFGDNAMIEPTLFDVLSQSSGIDTVIIVNSPGRDQNSWFPFGLMFADTTKSPPKKTSVSLSSDSTDILSDSVKGVSINVSPLETVNVDANLKSAKFEFDVDTAAFDLVSVSKGALLTSGSLSVSIDSIHVTARFSNADTSKIFTAGGELLRIFLKGKRRTDTLCTGFLNPKFTALNSDNLISGVTYMLKSICVLGKQPDTVTRNSVIVSQEKADLLIYPNPARSFIDFIMPQGYGEKKHLMVFDALGRKVFDEVFDANLRWEVASVPVGVYSATVTDFLSLQNSTAGTKKQKILIIH